MSRRTVRRLARAWLAAATTLLLVFAGVTANGAWRAMAAHRLASPVQMATVQPPLPQPVFASAAAAPAPGVTGTIALPSVPVPVAAAAATGATARPFSLGAASVADRGRALQCLAGAIYYEAASEPLAGQQAVAQVILNRVRHPAFPHTVCGVVYQGSERAGCQFSFACDGALARLPSRAAWAAAARVAAAALAGRVDPAVGLATHYHTYAVTPAWNRSLVMTGAVGAHFFHRWKGWWGTPAAFSARYTGGEPLPAPDVPVSAVAGAEVVPLPPPHPSLPPADALRSVAAPPRPAVDPLPDSGQVLDRWKDSGTPLR